MKEIVVTSTVEYRLFRHSSGIARMALVVRLPDGTDAALRMMGINPFMSKELENFVGMRVRINGLYSNGVLFVRHTDDITPLSPSARPSGPNLTPP